MFVLLLLPAELPAFGDIVARRTGVDNKNTLRLCAFASRNVKEIP